MTVLVLARDLDPTADAVVTALAGRGVPVLRTDLAAFPAELRLDARLVGGRWTGHLGHAHHSAALQDIRAIWNRSPGMFQIDAAVPAAMREFCVREAKLGLGGVLAALDVLWVNHPNRAADAIFKPLQWTTAAECGLAVADTVITNDIDAARRFIAEQPDATITKALGPAGIVEHGLRQVAYTRRLSDADLQDLQGVAATASTLQRCVPKAFEVRLTVVGEELFAVAIHAGTEHAQTDWRSDFGALTYDLIATPGRVHDAVTRYMDRMGLVFAGFDFVVTPEGEWVMLECNTAPQVGFVQAATGAPITDALATVLAKGTA